MSHSIPSRAANTTVDPRDQCNASITLRSDDHRWFRCQLKKGHSGVHVGPSIIWTDGDTRD